MDIAKIITWLVSGAIAGYFVGWLLTGRREGFGLWKNLLFGLAGGFLGGYLFVGHSGLVGGAQSFRRLVIRSHGTPRSAKVRGRARCGPRRWLDSP